MKKSIFNLAAACGFSLLAMNAYADQNSKSMSGMKMDSAPAHSRHAAPLSEGEVKAIDRENKSITLKHGRIESPTVQMAPMTMSFAVREKALLANVKVGDKVKFMLENINGTATVTILSVQK